MGLLAMAALCATSCSTPPPCARTDFADRLDTPGAVVPAFTRFIEAVTCGGRIWLRSESGYFAPAAIWSVGDTGRLPARHVAAGTIDVHVSADGYLYGLVAPDPEQPAHVLLLRFDGRAFVEVAALDLVTGDLAVAMSDDRGHPFVLGVEHLYVLGSRGWTVKPLAPSLGDDARKGSPAYVAAPRGRRVAYVGFDRGEFGGGIRVVDLESGAIRPVLLSDPTADHVAHAGRPVTDPITAIVDDPANPACVFAASGLRHLGPPAFGRVLRVCGDAGTIVLEQEHIRHWSREGVPIVESDPIDGAAADRSDAWAVSRDALYRLTGFGPRRQRLGSYERAGGLMMNRPGAGVVVVCGTVRDGQCERPLVTIRP